VLAGAFAAAAPLAPAERAVILVCIAAVIAAEVANTAIEATVDLVSPEWNERARIAKDAAAAAVLVLAAGSVLAFAAIAAAHRAELPALASRALRSVLPWGVVAAGVLPHRRSGRGLDAVLALLALATIADVAREASSQAGTCAVALCVAVALSAAWRKRRLEPAA
jgi:diacylglycerol kinase (ATP)